MYLVFSQSPQNFFPLAILVPRNIVCIQRSPVWQRMPIRAVQLQLTELQFRSLFCRLRWLKENITNSVPLRTKLKIFEVWHHIDSHRIEVEILSSTIDANNKSYLRLLGSKIPRMSIKRETTFPRDSFQLLTLHEMKIDSP